MEEKMSFVEKKILGLFRDVLSEGDRLECAPGFKDRLNVIDQYGDRKGYIEQDPENNCVTLFDMEGESWYVGDITGPHLSIVPKELDQELDRGTGDVQPENKLDLVILYNNLEKIQVHLSNALDYIEDPDERDIDDNLQSAADDLDSIVQGIFEFIGGPGNKPRTFKVACVAKTFA